MMSSMPSKIRLTLAVLVIGALAACQSSGVGTTGSNGENGGSTAANGGDTGQIATDNGGASGLDPLNDPNSPLANHSVYFDFNSYSVKDQYQPLLDAHSQYLKTHPERHVLIQGNTDERGTTEYNLALGQKRAEAVRRGLTTLGVSDSQLEAVSFGKERPVALGHNEQAWAQNRRADIVYRVSDQQ